MNKQRFQFKQFSVDQTSCAMKINTDGVLLGAIIGADKPATILDIGTGTGVIALMLAQRFIKAKIDAVEIDMDAAKTAEMNFKGSPFDNRLNVYPFSFETYFDQFPEKKYDLIVSNPPFYIRSLKSTGEKKTLAKHTDVDFFEKLIKCVADNLSPPGNCWLIMPVTLTDVIVELGANHCLYPQKVIDIHSYTHSDAHRVIMCFGFNKVLVQITKFTIYKSVGVYSEEYQKLLQPYFIAF
jgi:tRNA1Val (adenine37-N6)-methyltransferase